MISGSFIFDRFVFEYIKCSINEVGEEDVKKQAFRMDGYKGIHRVYYAR